MLNCPGFFEKTGHARIIFRPRSNASQTFSLLMLHRHVIEAWYWIFLLVALVAAGIYPKNRSWDLQENQGQTKIRKIRDRPRFISSKIIGLITGGTFIPPQPTDQNPTPSLPSGQYADTPKPRILFDEK